MRLRVEGFRSVREQEVALGPITLLYGPNGAGKSSLLYALFVLKNLLLAPNQPLPSFFNLGFLNLGGFREVVYRRNPQGTLALALEVEEAWQGERLRLRHGVALREPNWVEFAYTAWAEEDERPLLQARVEASLPYPGGALAPVPFSYKGTSLQLRWNGLAWTLESTPSPEVAAEVQDLLAHLNAPLERLRRVAFAPLGRGFTQPQYQPASFSGLPLREGEVATVLVQDPELELKVSAYLEEIAGRQLRARPQVGTSLFGLWVLDTATKVAHELVNEGFGVNQMVHLLAQALYRDTETLLVEEPEVHLHPSLVRRLARELARIALEEGKRFVLSTHSEALVSAFLGLVAEGTLPPEALVCYLAGKEAGETRFQPQRVTPDGRVEGGLLSFLEGELEDLRTLLSVRRG
ncbi:ATP-binding protein [Thermus caldilimi]|uniref:ATP-binding protein n=1 Tax=Thermus caldilimi TaxID=2483360 RepID=UPI00142D7926|nr:ATP-binding protein [Thermus caldilimi]